MTNRVKRIIFATCLGIGLSLILAGGIVLIHDAVIRSEYTKTTIVDKRTEQMTEEKTDEFQAGAVIVSSTDELTESEAILIQRSDESVIDDEDKSSESGSEETTEQTEEQTEESAEAEGAEQDDEE